MLLFLSMIGISISATSARAEDSTTLSIPSAPAPQSHRFWELWPQVSIVSASTMVLTNQIFEIPYSDSLQGIPTFSLGFTTPTSYKGNFEFSGVARIGYGYKQSNFTVKRLATGVESTDQIRLHSFPMMLLSKIGYAIPGIGGVKANFSAGLGAEVLYQNGQISGINDAFLLPRLYMGPSLTFGDQGGSSDDWFRGFTFGVNYETTIFTRQVFRGFSFDLSIGVVL